jgi:hypothetical protein
MTASLQPESKSASRRALLAGALGGLGAVAASAIGRGNPVRAATGDPVTVDGSFSGSGNTQITTVGTSGFRGISSDAGANAVWGVATSAVGGAWGVLGESSSTSGIGVVGIAHNASGTNYGVYGNATSPAGAGVLAVNTGGVALKTVGRTNFSTSGVASITAGSTSKTITPGVNVTSSSFVLLTPKVKLGGRDLWFTTNATGNRFTIHISSSRSSATKVAWLLLG